ncbi:gibberellin-regulated protein 11-like [Coffea arabica]|uniref:Gibberellin-regulated protein 11-like n=1 Tax=Coffea arabica TaxID=13443 RepID=A0ABM4W7E0_COFAR
MVTRRANRRLLPLMDCRGLCKVRCSLHSRPNLCSRACGTCCLRCKCVPPGTAGNREMCGKCYTDMTTHGNRTKCPSYKLTYVPSSLSFVPSSWQLWLVRWTTLPFLASCL